MTILIEVIPHKDQRYPTVGDWQWRNTDLVIKVSETGLWHYNVLLIIHELVEALLCYKDGLTTEMVDQWDLGHPELDEPGEHPECPYYDQHRIASLFERTFAFFLWINWERYEERIDSL